MTDVDIANLALTELGADTILALDEDSVNARRVNSVYAMIRDEVLRAHPWSFAIKRYYLPTIATTPLFEWQYAYQIPTDCLRVIDVYDKDGYSIDDESTSPPADRWVKEGSQILSDDTELYLKYIGRITDAAAFDAAFITAFAARLASELCYPITNSASLTKSLMDIYDVKLRRAKGFDSQEAGKTNVVGGDTYVQSRI